MVPFKKTKKATSPQRGHSSPQRGRKRSRSPPRRFDANSVRAALRGGVDLGRKVLRPLRRLRFRSDGSSYYDDDDKLPEFKPQSELPPRPQSQPQPQPQPQQAAAPQEQSLLVRRGALRRRGRDPEPILTNHHMAMGPPQTQPSTTPFEPNLELDAVTESMSRIKAQSVSIASRKSPRSAKSSKSSKSSKSKSSSGSSSSSGIMSHFDPDRGPSPSGPASRAKTDRRRLHRQGRRQRPSLPDLREGVQEDPHGLEMPPPEGLHGVMDPGAWLGSSKRKKINSPALASDVSNWADAISHAGHDGANAAPSPPSAYFASSEPSSAMSFGSSNFMRSRTPRQPPPSSPLRLAHTAQPGPSGQSDDTESMYPEPPQSRSPEPATSRYMENPGSAYTTAAEYMLPSPTHTDIGDDDDAAQKQKKDKGKGRDERPRPTLDELAHEADREYHNNPLQLFPTGPDVPWLAPRGTTRADLPGVPRLVDVDIEEAPGVLCSDPMLRHRLVQLPQGEEWRDFPERIVMRSEEDLLLNLQQGINEDMLWQQYNSQLSQMETQGEPEEMLQKLGNLLELEEKVQQRRQEQGEQQQPEQQQPEMQLFGQQQIEQQLSEQAQIERQEIERQQMVAMEQQIEQVKQMMEQLQQPVHQPEQQQQREDDEETVAPSSTGARKSSSSSSGLVTGSASLSSSDTGEFSMTKPLPLSPEELEAALDKIRRHYCLDSGMGFYEVRRWLETNLHLLRHTVLGTWPNPREHLETSRAPLEMSIESDANYNAVVNMWLALESIRWDSPRLTNFIRTSRRTSGGRLLRWARQRSLRRGRGRRPDALPPTIPDERLVGSNAAASARSGIPSFDLWRTRPLRRTSIFNPDTYTEAGRSAARARRNAASGGGS